MATLTQEQKELRRRVLIRNASRPDADTYFDLMLAGGDFCLEQLDIWADIFANEDASLLRQRAQQLLEQAAALEQAAVSGGE